MLLGIFLLFLSVYAVGYVVAAAWYLTWLGSLGLVGVLTALHSAVRWPIDLADRWFQ